MTRRRTRSARKAKTKTKTTAASSPEKEKKKPRTRSSPQKKSEDSAQGQAKVKAVPARSNTPPSSTETEGLQILLTQVQAALKRVDKRSKHQPCTEEDFRHMVDHLKNVCPVPERCKVTVRRAPHDEMPEDYGTVEKNKNVFEIIIDESLTEYETQHVILHEWAHMLAWQPYHPLSGDHSAMWGVWYARVWQKYYGVE